MTKLYVSEYAEVSIGLGGRVSQIPKEPPLTEYVVDYTAGEAHSAAFNAATQLVRVHADSICSLSFGTAATATTTNGRFAANQTEYRGVPRGGGYRVSAITNT